MALDTLDKTGPVVRPESARMARERRTITAMVQIYCRGLHRSNSNLCPECAEFLAYALARLERCRFQPDKPTCARCPVHCYKPAMRERARAVMRYAGPRMLLQHPVLAILHLLDGRRNLAR